MHPMPHDVGDGIHVAVTDATARNKRTSTRGCLSLPPPVRARYARAVASAVRAKTVRRAAPAASRRAAGGQTRRVVAAAGERLRDGHPRRRRRRGELLPTDGVRAPEQRVGGHGAQQPRRDAPHLSQDLFPRRQAHEPPSLEVLHQVARLPRRATRDGGGHEVGHGLAGRRRGEDELHDLAHRPDGVDVRLACAAHGDVAQERRHGQRQRGLPNRHPERTGEGRDGQKRRRDEPYSPPPFRNGVLDRVRTRVKRALLRGERFREERFREVVARSRRAGDFPSARALDARLPGASLALEIQARDAQNLARRLGRARHRNRRHVRARADGRAERRVGLLPERKGTRGGTRVKRRFTPSIVVVLRRLFSSETLIKARLEPRGDELREGVRRHRRDPRPEHRAARASLHVQGVVTVRDVPALYQPRSQHPVRADRAEQHGEPRLCAHERAAADQERVDSDPEPQPLRRAQAERGERRRFQERGGTPTSRPPPRTPRPQP